MSVADLMDKKRVHLRQMRRDQAGINPRLSLWAELEKECRKVEEELATMGAERTKQTALY